MNLAQIIMAYRKEHGISQRQMAAQCGLSTGYISLIEKEVNPQTGKPMTPTIENLNKIASAMGMTIDELMEACDDMQVKINKPATSEDSGLDEWVSLFYSLSVDNRSKLLELARLYQSSERNNTGTR